MNKAGQIVAKQGKNTQTDIFINEHMGSVSSVKMP